MVRDRPRLKSVSKQAVRAYEARLFSGSAKFTRWDRDTRVIATIQSPSKKGAPLWNQCRASIRDFVSTSYLSGVLCPPSKGARRE